MSKKIRLLSVGLVVFVVVLMAFAGTALAAYTPGLHSNVVGSRHDLGSKDNVCEECHVPHFASSSEFLWSTTPHAISSPSGSSSDIKPLCYSCHDGTATNLGQNSAFNTLWEQHRTVSKTDRIAAGKTKPGDIFGRDCDRCHDPHENTTERPNFIRYQRISATSTSYITTLGPGICVNCHTANVEGGTDTRSHPTPQHNHPTGLNGEVQDAWPALNPAMVVYDPSVGWGTRLFDPSSAYDPVTHRLLLGPVSVPTSQVNCESCHTPHGAQNEELNTMSIVDGGLCSNCHS